MSVARTSYPPPIEASSFKCVSIVVGHRGNKALGINFKRPGCINRDLVHTAELDARWLCVGVVAEVRLAAGALSYKGLRPVLVHGKATLLIRPLTST